MHTLVTALHVLSATYTQSVMIDIYGDVYPVLAFDELCKRRHSDIPTHWIGTFFGSKGLNDHNPTKSLGLFNPKRRFLKAFFESERFTGAVNCNSSGNYVASSRSFSSKVSATLGEW